MEVTERNDRPVDETPPLIERGEVPRVFQRTYRGSRVALCIGVVTGYLFSLVLLLFAAVGLTDPEFVAMGVVFGLFGLIALVASVAGSWRLIKGPTVYFITLEPDEVIWGGVGDERRLAVSEIASIHYAVDTDSDSSVDLTFAFKTHAGERLPVRRIDRLVPRKIRPKLLAYLRTHYSDARLLVSE